MKIWKTFFYKIFEDY